MRVIICLIFSVGLLFKSLAQHNVIGSLDYKKPLLDIRSVKTGPYVGIQKGKYTILEIGGTRQWKRIKFVNPIVHAASVGMNYNFKHNVLGIDAGYWIRPHRLGFTYGGTLFYRTDFTYNKIGIAPVIGFKIWLAHLQVGYHIMDSPQDFETNTLFISLRLGWINDRDIDWKRNNKN